MARKQPVIAAQHSATGIPLNARQGGELTVAGVTGNAAVTHGRGGGGANPSPKAFNRKGEKAKLIKESKRYFAQTTDLGEPPSSYLSDKFYRIQLTESVQDGAGNWLRPSHDVVVSGDFATSIADKISGAAEL